MRDAEIWYQHLPTATKPTISTDKPVPGYLPYQNKGNKHCKTRLDWKDRPYCSSLTAIGGAAQTYFGIKTSSLPLNSQVLIMFWESALKGW